MHGDLGSGWSTLSRHQLHLNPASHSTWASLVLSNLLALLFFPCFHNSVLTIFWPLRLPFFWSLTPLSVSLLRVRFRCGSLVLMTVKGGCCKIPVMTRQQRMQTDSKKWNQQIRQIFRSCNSAKKNASGLLIGSRAAWRQLRGAETMKELPVREALTTSSCPHYIAIMFLIVKQRYTTIVW